LQFVIFYQIEDVFGLNSLPFYPFRSTFATAN